MKLLNGFSVLKHSGIAGRDSFVYNYRMATDGEVYVVHVEEMNLNGSYDEAILYFGESVDEAGRCYAEHTMN